MTESKGVKSKGRERAVRQRKLADELKRQTGQLKAINNVITAASESQDLKQTLQAALDAALSVVPIEASGISLVDEQADELVMVAQRGWKYDFVTRPMRVKLGEGLSGLAIKTGDVVITGDLSGDPRLAVPAFIREQAKAMVLVPMRARGRVVGVLSVLSHKPYSFDTDEINALRVIGDQVGLAIENARLYESVKEQQSRLEAVLHSTADAIIATDNLGNINLVNQAAERLFELDADHILGLPLRSAPLPPQLRDHLREAMNREDPASGQLFEVVLESGRCLSAVVSPVYSQAPLDRDLADGWVAVFQDITHLKEAERARLQFIQTAAHDLRNPLGVTLSALTMLTKGWDSPSPTEQEIFRIAMTGLNRMQDLIDDLLNLENISSGLDVRHDPINVPEMLESCAIDVGPVLQRKEQNLKLAVDLSMPTFFGDERWLNRALMNLLTNAHKYTQVGSTITIRAEARGSDLTIQVEDDGPGIPLEAQARLFERFYRVRRGDEKIPGTGLGLAMVKSVVEQHGGKVFVRSEPGHGSIFGMIMPITESEGAI